MPEASDPESNGSKKPRKLGLSTEKIKDIKTLEQLLLLANQISAIDFVDCSWRNGNEPFIGMALKHLRQRDNRFDLILPFQSKAWPTKFVGGINKSLRFSLQKIGAFDCIDTYFLHCPADSWSTNLLAYKQLIECMNNGQTKKIGLGSFSVDMMERLAQFTHKYPHVLQQNLSVNRLDTSLMDFCRQHNIELQAYEPLGEFRSNSKNPILQTMATKYGCDVRGLLIAYLLELGIVPVVSYEKPEDLHQLEHIKTLKISKGDMEILASLNKYKPRRRK